MMSRVSVNLLNAAVAGDSPAFMHSPQVNTNEWRATLVPLAGVR